MTDDQIAFPDGPPIFVDSDQALARWCERWSHASVLALDTEFIRTDTFYPIGALIQITDGHHCVLVDPLSVGDLTPLQHLLSEPGVLKVLHSCSEDLEVFDRLFGVLPEPLFDTQIAAAMDGHGFSLSYQRLTEILLGHHVPKGETRSNWLQRPLTDSQIHYAALDVAYLLEIYRMLADSLAAKGRLDWLREECEQQLLNYRQTSDGAAYYQRIKAASRLNEQDLWRLKTLIDWREATARERDRPRGRILKDKSCFEIIRTRPQTPEALAAISEVGPGTVRRYGEQILSLLAQPLQGEPPAPLPAPLPASTRNVISHLKSLVKKRAAQLQMAEEVLARKRDLEALVGSGTETGHYELPESLQGWRKTEIGDRLLAALSSA